MADSVFSVFQKLVNLVNFCVFLVFRWMSIIQCIKSSVQTWLITLISSEVCWSELRMRV